MKYLSKIMLLIYNIKSVYYLQFLGASTSLMNNYFSVNFQHLSSSHSYVSCNIFTQVHKLDAHSYIEHLTKYSDPSLVVRIIIFKAIVYYSNKASII